ncbi:MAG: T9SS type A sorting domain-containing protein [Flavobacteriales bacterium]|nr:T9SS type A sorting domain-containing protein [Flavobacteriales bacterium]
MKQLNAFVFCALISSPALSVTVTIQMYIPAFCTYPTGSIYAQPQGGTEPYTYSWSTGSTDSWLNDLVAGTYSVTVTDANLEQATAEFTLTASPFEAWVDGMVGCPDQMLGPPFRMLGQASIYNTGVPPLTLSGNYVSDVIDGPNGYAALYVGNFDMWPPAGTPLSIAFTDANGCPGTIYGQVPQPPAHPDRQVLMVDAACAAEFNGSALVQVDEAPNDDPYLLRLIRDGADAGDLQTQSTIGQMFGQIPHNILRQNLAPGEYALVSSPRFEDSAYEWLEGYFFVSEDYCTDTVWFTVPEMPGPCGTLKGTVYMDDNQDCIMAGLETRVPNEVMLIEPGGYTAMSGANGYYQVNLPTGSYTVEQASAVLDEHCIGGPIPFNLGSNGQSVTQNMGDTVLVPRDIELFIGSGPARPGFNYNLCLHIHHETLGGTGTLTVSCTFDPALTFTSASPTPVVNGNTLTWTLAQLISFGNRHINVNLQVPPNPALIGTELMHSATASIAQPETNLTNNSAVHLRTVTGSYDPNDKLATTSSQLSDALYYIDQDEWIDYTIRFQNTGTDTAFNVVITDTLPPTLDPGTFELGPRSHSCITQMAGQGIVRFIFNNIQLPDSNVNEPASHGLVQFRIKPHLPIAPVTVIENIASIFFDFNPPVITEPSVLVAEFSTRVQEEGQEELRVFPNPASDELTVMLSEPANGHIRVMEMDGRVVTEQRMTGPSVTLDVSRLSTGAYMLEVLEGSGGRRLSRFVRQ